MSIVIAPCRNDDLPTLRALARHPSLAHEFEPLGDSLEELLRALGEDR